MNGILRDHFCCPELTTGFSVSGDLSDRPGYFRVGGNLVGYGRLTKEVATDGPSRDFPDCEPLIHIDRDHIALPFDPHEVIENLRLESYARHANGNVTQLGAHPWVRSMYYLGRPYLPIPARSFLQRLWLRNAMEMSFPAWPVDRTVDRFFELLLTLALQARGNDPIPFIWFWPDEAQAAMILTHDVETVRGRDFTQ